MGALKDWCPKCHTKPGGQFCTDCGSRLQSNPDDKRCPNCLMAINSTYKFCFNCGEQLQFNETS